MQVTEADCADFPGGYSLCPKQVTNALNAVSYADELRILEFGCGRGTSALLDLLDRKGIGCRYVTYENDPRYLISRPSLEVIIWASLPTIIPGQYDLIIIDGPNGVDRAKWYPLIRGCVVPGTILLIDDFDHYAEFGEALDATFEYEEIDRQTAHEECWKTVRVRGVK